MKKDKKLEKNQEQVEAMDNEAIVLSPDYSDEEVSYRKFLIKRLTSSKVQKDKAREEFDGMDYYTWYKTNKRSANSFIRPATKKGETRITTAVTENKSDALINTLLNVNAEVNMDAYDEEDQKAAELGSIVEGLVKKSRDIEEYTQKKRRPIYKEMADQGTVFTEEVNIQREIIEKELKDKQWWAKDIKEIEWVTKSFKLFNECETRMISGMKVFLGDMEIFEMGKQPYAGTIEYLDREVAESYFGKWERWKNVPDVDAPIESEISTDNSNFRVYDKEQTKRIEVVKYQDKWKNEYMIMLNGVMMLPIGFPLSAISKDGEYSIVKGVLNPISFNFAYGKSISAKTKVPQALLDKFLKLFIRKTEKSIDPPMVKRGGGKISKNIFNPSTLTQNVDPDSISELGDNPGVTTSEIAMYDIARGIVDEMSLSSQFTDPGGKGEANTATQATLNKEQNLLKMGNAIAGILVFETDLYKRRTPNLLDVWTTKVDSKINEATNKFQNVFRKVTTNISANGKDSLAQIEFSDAGEYPSPEAIYKEEKELSEKIGESVKKVYLDAPMLRQIKYKYKYTAVPTEKNTDALKKAMFSQNVIEAMEIFGPDSLNYESLKKRFAEVNKEDEDVFFIKGQDSISPMMATGPEGSAPKGPDTSELKPKAPATPSVNTLSKN